MSCGLDICYCQSNSIIYNILYCFNTSHVTLYPVMACKATTKLSFQYISCYSLSGWLQEEIEKRKEFQYISCYSLSQPQAESFLPVLHVSIHLMLLFIRWLKNVERKISYVSIHLMLLFILTTTSLLDSFSSFNTSHVTLYHIGIQHVKQQI